MGRISSLELGTYLEEICSCKALELHRSEEADGSLRMYIPYMMNDALECYLVLEDASMTGTYKTDNQDEISAEVVSTERGPAVIFRQGSDNVFTIWYTGCFKEQACYRYDQIGHFWVKGDEQWRRLVYMIGTIYDKYSYMGDMVCNDKELELMPLMEFAPFRSFSPIHESLADYYEDSAAGCLTMRMLAEEAGDRSFLCWLSMYERLPFKRKIGQFLAEAMRRPERARLYELIFMKVQEASMEYPERTYPVSLAKEMESQRTLVRETMKTAGFYGEYPLFHRGQLQILAMEEHPFTILESEHYGFKIQFMVSEINAKDQSICIGEESGYLRNAGFFKKKGNRGWIAQNLDFLASFSLK